MDEVWYEENKVGGLIFIELHSTMLGMHHGVIFFHIAHGRQKGIVQCAIPLTMVVF